MITRFLIFNILLSSSALNAKEALTPIESSTSLYDLIVQGGWSMFPLGAVCLFMFYLVFYCFAETRRKKFVPDNVIDDLKQHMMIKDIYSADLILSANKTHMSDALKASLSRVRFDRDDFNREQVETTLIEKLEIEDNTMSAWINYLNVCAAIAPMIGLLGTVSGMIGAFQIIGTQGMGDPSALAGDIGQALITTAAGLSIGIPAMVFFFILRNRLNSRICEAAQCATLLIDQLCNIDNMVEQQVEHIE